MLVARPVRPRAHARKVKTIFNSQSTDSELALSSLVSLASSARQGAVNPDAARLSIEELRGAVHLGDRKLCVDIPGPRIVHEAIEIHTAGFTRILSRGIHDPARTSVHPVEIVVVGFVLERLPRKTVLLHPTAIPSQQHIVVAFRKADAPPCEAV